MTEIKELYGLIETIGKSDLGWSTSVFLEAVKAKRMKRGAFDKGYILMSSNLRVEPILNQSEQYGLGLDGEDYGEIPFLEYPVTKYADFLEKNNGELLLRFSLPLCFNSHQIVFDSAKVQQFIGRDNMLVINIARTKESVLLEVYMKAERYEQDSMW